ncbi:hypothetical protein FTW19_11570 [Terriglobus albidus]|uniref:Uncharacterized protein n=1 Tax=Terriglobus albidus TaxID=1592106 RepID=A0A5B9E9W8_9BACT|nr:hypothetical protein [Terriglobus albidus]QEE28579.1 hypothetical protein FTW19_11570 [Terriglobus albidus]
MKVKEVPELLNAVQNPDLNLPSDAGEMEVEEFVAWAQAAKDDAEAELQKIDEELAIAKEVAFLTDDVRKQHPNLPLSQLVDLLPEPRRSLVIELIKAASQAEADWLKPAKE